MDDSELHNIAKQEVESKTYDKDLWHKAMALMGNDEEKAKEKYIKLRILQFKRDGYKPKKKIDNPAPISSNKSINEPESKSEPNNKQSKNDNSNEKKKNDGSWILWGLVAVFVIWLIIANNESKSSNNKSNTSYSSKSNNYSSNYTSIKQDDYIESKPSGSTYILSKHELLYCEAEQIRLDIIKNKIDKYSQYEIDKYNSLTSDYNSRCVNKQYYQKDMYKVNQLIQNRKSKIEQEGLASFYKSSSTIDSLKNNPSVANENCEVTIFKDGSIGATLNGKFEPWKSMSLSDKEKCTEALKEAQNKAGYAGDKSKKIKKIIEKYPLTIIANPSDARVQIMNIKPKYYDGIRLIKGKYKIRISKKGYVTQNHIFDPSEFSIYNVILKKNSDTKSNNLSSANCKVTIYNDGSIGARINGTTTTWNSMSSWERKQCEKALKKEQARVGRKVNIHDITITNNTSPSSERGSCKVTIYNDGSIGARLNGTTTTWNSMSSWEKKSCQKALRDEENRIARKGNTNYFNTIEDCKVTIFNDGSIGAKINGHFNQWKNMSPWEKKSCEKALRKEEYRIARKRTDKYSLTINTTPSDARVQIMNIKPKYYDGLRLQKGNYDIKISKRGYTTIRKWIKLEKNEYLTFNLKRKTTYSSQRPNLSHLTLKEQNFIAYACSAARYSDPLEYNKCLHRQLNKLGK